MGHASATLKFSNPRRPEIRSVEVEALADSGASFLCIPSELASELQLETETDRKITLANGQTQSCPYVGPIQVSFENRSCYTGALVLGESVLLGVLQMEDMDMVVHPLQQKIVANPESPDVIHGRA